MVLVDNVLSQQSFTLDEILGRERGFSQSKKGKNLQARKKKNKGGMKKPNEDCNCPILRSSSSCGCSENTKCGCRNKNTRQNGRKARKMRKKRGANRKGKRNKIASSSKKRNRHKSFRQSSNKNKSRKNRPKSHQGLPHKKRLLNHRRHKERGLLLGPRSLKNYIPPLVSGSQRDLRPQVVSHTMPAIERLFAPLGPPKNDYDNRDSDSDSELSRDGLYPASYDGPPGPKCNWRKCSNKGGCGSECVCHPAGWYGWRCIPKCCIRADGSPPCRYLYKYPVQCTLPCDTWPGLCQENYWNPYHVYQGPLQYPKSQAPTLTAL